MAAPTQRGHAFVVSALRVDITTGFDTGISPIACTVASAQLAITAVGVLEAPVIRTEWTTTAPNTAPIVAITTVGIRSTTGFGKIAGGVDGWTARVAGERDRPAYARTDVVFLSEAP